MTTPPRVLRLGNCGRNPRETCAKAATFSGAFPVRLTVTPARGLSLDPLKLETTPVSERRSS